MLIPKVKASEFEKFGFKRCKGVPKELECYYLCIARGSKMLFVSNVCFDINDWDEMTQEYIKKLIVDTEM